MIVCVCNAVSSGEIAREASGCSSFEQLQENLGVALACGACRDCAKQCFDQHRRAPLVIDLGKRAEDLVPTWLVPVPALAK